MLDVYRGHLLVYLPYKCEISSLMLPQNKKLNIDIYTLNITGHIIIPKSSVVSTQFHLMPMLRMSGSLPPLPISLYDMYTDNFIFLSLVSVLLQLFVDCHVRADHYRCLKERGGFWSNKFNECPSLDERFIGWWWGHTQDVMTIIKDYRRCVLLISLFSFVQGGERNAACLHLLGSLNTIPQLRVCWLLSSASLNARSQLSSVQQS